MSKKPSLFTAISVSICTMIGSGWLYASYYASQATGAASIISWIIGAVIVLSMAFLLSEIAVKYPANGLFAQLITISHNNKHLGFVTGSSSWILSLITVPSEAMATIQYVSSIYEPVKSYLFADGQLTNYGIVVVTVLMLVYMCLNYWGIKLLSKVNNSLTTFKIIVPIGTAIIMLLTAFHASNFSGDNVSFMPNGTGSIFSSLISCGIIYSFFGFQNATHFCAELDNPKRNIPIALIGSVFVVLLIYLLLQISFIGAVPPDMLKNGWQGLSFQSPLTQLAGILGLNIIAIILYVDAAVSPSAAGAIVIGTSARMLNEMAKAKQMPKYFAKTNNKVGISRASLVFSFVCSFLLILFFRNWQMISSLATTFILVAAMALPVSYAKLKANIKDPLPVSYIPFSQLVAFILFLILTYLLMIAPSVDIAAALVLHLVLFVIYSFVNNSGDFTKIRKAFSSAYIIFVYFIFELIMSLISLKFATSVVFYIIFIIISAILYLLMVKQRCYD